MLNRYLLFAFGQYYPAGGEGDAQVSAESLPALALEYEKLNYHRHDYHDILDLEERRWLSAEEVNLFCSLVNS
jgi:hypothetical protein